MRRQRLRQQFRDVQRLAAGALLDLLAATKAVGEDERVAPAPARTRGSSTRSAAAIETSYCRRSKPNEPAMPQQPDFMTS